MPPLFGIPLNIKRFAITKQRPPNPFSNLCLNMEALVSLFEPFKNVGEAREQHGKTEADHTCVEPLRSRPKTSWHVFRFVGATIRSRTECSSVFQPVENSDVGSPGRIQTCSLLVNKPSQRFNQILPQPS